MATGSVTLAASVGNGSATILQLDSSTSAYDTYVRNQLTASADAGWHFVRWECRSQHTTNNNSPNPTTSNWSSWYGISTSITDTVSNRIKTEVPPGDVSWTQYGYYWYEDFEYRAVFEQDSSPPGQTYTVTVVADPVAGGTVTGGGQYQANSSCTIGATAEDDYEFVKWTSSDGDVTTDNPKTFTVTKNITWTAHFHYCTNLLLHDPSGILLHGSSDTLLHDA